MKNLVIKRALVSVRIGAITLIGGCLFSCASNTVDSNAVEDPNLNGVWVDTLGGLSTMSLDHGAFTLKVPNPLVPFDEPEVHDSSFHLPDNIFHGFYEIVADSFFLDYVFESSEFPHQEPFRFQFFGDSLFLHFNNDAGVDSSFNERDTLHLNGFPQMVRPPSLLWPPTSGRFSGVFRRLE